MTKSHEHPHHYNHGKMETWDWIEQGLTTDEYIGGLKFNILKYLHRFELKNGAEDLDKAIEYIKKMKEVLYGEKK